jgi:hypothetical protein
MKQRLASSYRSSLSLHDIYFSLKTRISIFALPKKLLMRCERAKHEISALKSDKRKMLNEKIQIANEISIGWHCHAE